jgi:hypothetical protein
MNEVFSVKCSYTIIIIMCNGIVIIAHGAIPVKKNLIPYFEYPSIATYLMVGGFLPSQV